MLDYIPKLVMEEENEHITTLPLKEDMKQSIYELNGNSVARTDGFSMIFF